MAAVYESPCRFSAEQEVPWPQDRQLGFARDILPAGTRLFSADSHVLEPADWTEFMPPQYRDRAPREWSDEHGQIHYDYNGVEVSVGLDPCVSEGRPGIGAMDRRMADLDIEGVEAEMLYPQRSFALVAGVRSSHRDLVLQDESYAGAYLRAYNTYLADLCSQHPGRLFGAAMVRFWDPEGMSDNLAEVKDLGFRAIVLPTAPPGVHYNSPHMEPMWTAIEEAGLPLSFHVGERFETEGPGAFGASLMMSFHPFRKLWSLLTFAGILERHPELRVVFTEGGLHWIPGTLADADHFYRNFRSIMEPRLAHQPSFYWHKNCFATFQEDAIGLAMADRIGHERILWASDYPHPEGTIGHTADSAQEVLKAVGRDKAAAILNNNARDLWKLN